MFRFNLISGQITMMSVNLFHYSYLRSHITSHKLTEHLFRTQWHCALKQSQSFLLFIPQDFGNSDILLHVDMTVSHHFCKFMLPISCSTICERHSVGFTSGDWGGHGSSLSLLSDILRSLETSRTFFRRRMWGLECRTGTIWKCSSWWELVWLGHSPAAFSRVHVWARLR